MDLFKKIIDMDEDKNELGLYLNDKLSFVGQVIREDNEPKKTNIIIIKSLNNKNKNINKCKLPSPFNEEVIYGDIILLPMNENIQPENIYIQEYYDLFNNNLK